MTLSLTNFWSTTTLPAVIRDEAEVVQHDCFENPVSLQLSNVSLKVQLTNNPDDIARININYCDFGGHENVTARDAQPADFVDDVRRLDGERLPDHRGDGVGMSLRQGPDILNSGGVRIGYEAKLENGGVKVGHFVLRAVAWRAWRSIPWSFTGRIVRPAPTA